MVHNKAELTPRGLGVYADGGTLIVTPTPRQWRMPGRRRCVLRLRLWLLIRSRLFLLPRLLQPRLRRWRRLMVCLLLLCLLRLR